MKQHEVFIGGAGYNNRYPWDKLEIGDYFKIPTKAIKPRTIRSLAHFRKTSHRQRFRVQTKSDFITVTRIE